MNDTAQDLRSALLPFANCCEQISDDEPDEEWAKFRLTVGDYRRAKAALIQDRIERSEAIKEVVGLCNRIPGSTQWNAAEFMYDLLVKSGSVPQTIAAAATDEPVGLRDVEGDGK